MSSTLAGIRGLRAGACRMASDRRAHCEDLPDISTRAHTPLSILPVPSDRSVSSQRVIEYVIFAAMNRTCQRPARAGALASRQEVVARAEAYIRSHCYAPVPVSTLSRLVGRSERGLREAFYSVRGMSPKQYELANRLQAVRDALSDVETRPSSVSAVASEFGFFEFGRFAGAYREAFGETPSETLRRANRRASAEPTSTSRREHQCLHERTSGQSSNTGHAYPGLSQRTGRSPTFRG
jgi:methylphosphotriester-DNA--protein-cysteine methyltransferase